MPLTKATIDDADVAGRRVLVRVDFNVPMRDGGIVDDRRIRAALPTLEALRTRGARTVVVTHLGRPTGEVRPELSVAPLAARLGELLNTHVAVAGDVVGESAQKVAAALADGEVAMLENVRFEPGEERNDEHLAEQLAALADLYVNDAFGTAHRAHASTEGVTHHLPACAGYLMERELEVLGGVLDDPARPLVAVVGGSKVSSKIGVLRSLLQRCDTLWIGGAMACTFFRAEGAETGRSLVEEDQVETARALRREAGAALRLPADVVVADRAEAGAQTAVVSWDAIPADRMAVDVGPQTIIQMIGSFAGAATVVWNGPLGIYEIEQFAAATRAVAQGLADSDATSIIGGGDLAAVIDDIGVGERMSFVSTGGGATLEFLEGRTLPGVAALRDRQAVSG